MYVVDIVLKTDKTHFKLKEEHYQEETKKKSRSP